MMNSQTKKISFHLQPLSTLLLNIETRCECKQQGSRSIMSVSVVTLFSNLIFSKVHCGIKKYIFDYILRPKGARVLDVVAAARLECFRALQISRYSKNISFR